jgi:hypothetical protein
MKIISVTSSGMIILLVMLCTWTDFVRIDGVLIELKHKLCSGLKVQCNLAFCGVHVSKNLPMEYYEKCISQSEGPFLVIGDDVPNFRGKEYVIHEAKTEIDALIALRSCRKLILSNTSLAWWANYLSLNARYCYAPIPWRADCNWSHIYTENMSLIGV